MFDKQTMTRLFARLSAVALTLAVAVPAPFGAEAKAASALDVGVLLSQSSKDFGNGIPSHPYAKTNVEEREETVRQWVIDIHHHQLVELKATGTSGWC